MKRAVDFDGTLAYQDNELGHYCLGDPIYPMVDRVKKWLSEDDEVIIFTARASTMSDLEKRDIERFCEKYIGRVLPITCIKTRDIDVFYDDKAVQVIFNTGKVVSVE